MILPQQYFSKYLIVSEIFGMLRFPDFEKKYEANLSFFMRFLFLILQTCSMYQIVGNLTQNIAASMYFFQIFYSLSDLFNVIDFHLFSILIKHN